MTVEEAIEELKRWPKDAEVTALKLELVKPAMQNHAAVSPGWPPKDIGQAEQTKSFAPG